VDFHDRTFTRKRGGDTSASAARLRLISLPWLPLGSSKPEKPKKKQFPNKGLYEAPFGLARGFDAILADSHRFEPSQGSR
jgi:hypothetical protein